MAIPTAAIGTVRARLHSLSMYIVFLQKGRRLRAWPGVAAYSSKNAASFS
jgi:hypothetical protein